MAKRHRIGSDPLDDLVPSRASRTRVSPSPSPRPSTTHRIRSTSKAPAPPQPTAAPATDSDPADWDANNVRVTFYCPRPLLGQVESEMTRSGLSKTRVIVEALHSHLKAR